MTAVEGLDARLAPVFESLIGRPIAHLLRRSKTLKVLGGYVNECSLSVPVPVPIHVDQMCIDELRQTVASL